MALPQAKKSQSRQSYKRTKKFMPEFKRQTKFNFFGLPCELRDQIYDEIWKDSSVILIPREGIKLLIVYNNGAKNVTPLPRWVFSSKALLNEAVEQLSFKLTWTWKPDRLEGVCHKSKTESSDSSLFLSLKYLCPSMARDMRIDFGGLLYHAKSPHNGTAGSLRVQVWKADDIDTLVGLLEESSNLKTLHLRFGLGQTKRLNLRHNWTIDLSAIEKTGLESLEKVEITVVNCISLAGEMPEDIGQILRDEVSRFRRKIMHGKNDAIDPEKEVAMTDLEKYCGKFGREEDDENSESTRDSDSHQYSSIVSRKRPRGISNDDEVDGEEINRLGRPTANKRRRNDGDIEEHIESISPTVKEWQRNDEIAREQGEHGDLVMRRTKVQEQSIKLN